MTAEQQTHGAGLATPETGHVEIRIEATGRRTVMVNGQDWTRHVWDVHMSVQPVQPPEIVMRSAPLTDYTFDGPGVVRVVEEVSTPWARQAAVWLDHLDWNAVQRKVAEGSMAQGLADAIHGVLADELARAVAAEARA